MKCVALMTSDQFQMTNGYYSGVGCVLSSDVGSTCLSHPLLAERGVAIGARLVCLHGLGQTEPVAPPPATSSAAEAAPLARRSSPKQGECPMDLGVALDSGKRMPDPCEGQQDGERHSTGQRVRIIGLPVFRAPRGIPL